MAYTPLTLPTLSLTGQSTDVAAVGNWATACASRVNESAQGFLTDLADLGAIEFSQVGDLPALNSIVWLGTAIGAENKPQRPSLTISNLTELLSRLNQLVPPEAPNATYTYTDPGYSSILRDPVMQKLLTDLVQGGYGIEVADEEALWTRAREREANTYTAAIEEIRRNATQSGFPVPPGSLQKRLDAAAQEYAAKVSSINRDIALKRADMYVENRRFIIEKVLESEQQSIALYNAIQNRAADIARLNVELAVSLFDAGIRLFRMKQEAILAEVDAPLRVNQQLVSLYSADVSAYAALVNATAQQAQVDIANSRNILQRDIASHQSRVDIVRFRLQQLAATIEKNRDIYKYGVDYFRTALGTAMSNVNGLAVQTTEV